MKKIIIILFLFTIISYSLLTWMQSNQWRNYHVVYDNFRFVALEKDRRLSEYDLAKSIPISMDFNENMRLYMKRIQRLASTNLPSCQYFIVGTHAINKKNRQVFGLIIEDGRFKGYFLSHANPNIPNPNITKNIFFNDDKKLSQRIFQQLIESKEQFCSAERSD